MFSIDVKGREPIYTQIEKNIVKFINLGVYEKDSMLPSVRALACEIGINPNTVAKAYKNLEANDVIYTVVGKGVFVKGQTHLSAVHKLALDKIKKELADAKNSGLEKSEIINLAEIVWEESTDD